MNTDEKIILLPVSSSGAATGSLLIQSGSKGAEGQAFAGITDTWAVVRKKIYNMYKSYNGQQPKYEGFDASGDLNYQNPDLTLPQQRTVIAIISVGCASLLMLIILCYIFCRRAKMNQVPQYLAVHFPLYGAGENSHANTPMDEIAGSSSKSLSSSSPVVVVEQV